LVKKIPTRPVNRSAAVNYLGKAHQFSRAMVESLDKGDWDAAGLNAVHCAISANDAVLVLTRGVRSASPRHDDSVTLLESMVNATGVKSATAQLKRLIAKKNVIEYEERLFKENEARDAVKNASRVLTWAEGLFAKKPG
jgi:HEPN domain-containing protein